MNRNVVRSGLVLVAALVSLAPAHTREDEYVRNYGFRVEFKPDPAPPGQGSGANVLKNVREVVIDDLNIDSREMTTGPDVEYRVYAPGAAHFGNATFTIDCIGATERELRRWIAQARNNGPRRRDITITLFKSDKTPGRSYTLNQAVPVQFTDCAASGQQSMTLVVRPRTITFGAQPQPQPPPDPDFQPWVRIEVRGRDGRLNPDDDWESLVGGALSREDPPLVLGKIDPQDPAIDTKPHLTVTPITLSGPMTATRSWLTDWLNDTVTQQKWQRDLFITAGRPGIYRVGFPRKYVFPKLDARSSGHATEKIEISFETFELKAAN